MTPTSVSLLAKAVKSSKMVSTRLMIVVATALLAVIVPAGAASAEQVQKENVDAESVRETISTDCPIEVANQRGGNCDVVSEVTVSEEKVATSEQIEAASGLTSDNGEELQDVAAARTIYTKSWSQTLDDTLNWFSVRHKGTAFYDNNGNVWSTSEKFNKTGYHTCYVKHTYLVSISGDGCYTQKRYDLPDTAISEWYRFTVSSGVGDWKGSWGLSIHVNIYHNGEIYRHTCSLC
ncbi:hypothetical protein [Haloglycomyces albus]|uniref:hypothetical protein n=1 Tax=Haloglycomyces albus TaxID=526067 RepID=UPI00046D8E6D|nr:hypothetical protein [Haloglycomyces albus]